MNRAISTLLILGSFALAPICSAYADFTDPPAIGQPNGPFGSGTPEDPYIFQYPISGSFDNGLLESANIRVEDENGEPYMIQMLQQYDAQGNPIGDPQANIITPVLNDNGDPILDANGNPVVETNPID